MIGAYQPVPAFAYPGWRLSVPGGPAGGHYKGFTHTQAAGTDIPPQDQYEQDREDGMSSHDLVHATPRNPRGVYRSSGEVPPRPNAAGSAHTYRSFQTQRHAGTSVAPGSFPADFVESDEDAFLSRFGLHGLGVMLPRLIDGGIYDPGSVGPIIRGPFQTAGSATATAPTPAPAPVPSRPNICTTPSVAPNGQHWEYAGVDSFGCTFYNLVPDAPAVHPFAPPPPPSTGATSVVNQPPATPAPLPPSPSVPVVLAPPVSPAPAPVVNTNQAVPLNDGSGNFLNVSTGQIIPGSAVAQNPATGQLTASLSSAISTGASGALSWLEQNSIFSAVPNWMVLGGGVLLASMLGGGSARHRR
jgi:hypothetical protein